MCLSYTSVGEIKKKFTGTSLMVIGSVSTQTSFDISITHLVVRILALITAHSLVGLMESGLILHSQHQHSVALILNNH